VKKKALEAKKEELDLSSKEKNRLKKMFMI